MPQSLTFLNRLTSPFRPPFNGLWLIILFYYAACFLLYPNSQLLKGNLSDPDDYMYLVQVMDWLKGAGWYDNIQHRINPPDGIVIHFSRLAQMPMAVLIMLFERFGLEMKRAVILMALIYPLILLAGFLLTLCWLAKSFMPKEWTGATAYAALFAAAPLSMFQPGHVDNHGLIVLIVALALGCALRMMENPEDTRWGVATGATLALGQTLALEILPWVLLISGWLGLRAVIKGRAAARNGFAFGLALWLASILGLLLTRPPAAFFAVDLLTTSIVYVWLTGGIAACFAGVAAMAKTRLAPRLIVGAILASLTGGFFLHRFPELITGPYGAMPPELAELILKVVDEAIPMTQRLPSFIALLIYLSPALVALGLGLYFFWKALGQERWLWGLLLTLLTAACLLTVFYQSRFAGSMGMLTIIPLTVFLQRGWSRKKYNQGIDKIFAKIGLLLLVGPLLPVCLFVAVNGIDFHVTDAVLFPAASVNENACNASDLAPMLNDPASFGNHPRLIVNDMLTGPELLFRTPHSVLAAPFFDVAGNVDAYRFFATRSPDEAKSIARRRHIDLVVSCAGIPASYINKSGPSKAGIPEVSSDSFIINLLVPGGMPNWLHEIKTPGLDTFDVYEVRPPE